MDGTADVIAMLCRRIKLARIEKNLSQIELAERSQLGIATIKRIELGESITLQTLISVLRGIGELDQLNNLLAHKEVRAGVRKHYPLPRRKRRKAPLDDDKIDGPEQNDFITSQLNNMHWKY